MKENSNMKVITNGTVYEIRDDSIEIKDTFPAQTYIIRFNKMTGFYMEKYSDIRVREEKVYGIHADKVKKVLRSFDMFERNLGVILSGNKGIGKSLFAKMLSEEAVKKGLPVIVVDSFYPGIASYIEKIDQEVLVLFDEFDKTFGNIRTSENEADPQAGLLTLFDGISQGKKLFVITCNELRSLNDYLVNRPGRFHYHFRFEYPSADEIREYLKDKLRSEYYNEINKVILFSHKVNLNYDCLRAIAYELNTGEPFENAIKDLNIINMNSERYNVFLYFKDGTTMEARNEYLDLFSKDDTEEVDVYDSEGRSVIEVDFNPVDCIFDMEKRAQVVYADKLKLIYSDYYEKEVMDKVKELQADYLEIKRCHDRDIHYAV